MSIDRVINMVINRVLRVLVNKGVDGAINAASGKKKRRNRQE
ncbi:MAG: hypothetical protein QGI08_01035 [Paracoccaceae bacterium]|jgi:hypothetical protein|nr:hypothetical protein [Paracoccaceae bacterium]MDP7184288.1 hypothetical protein [Paracoccaceae bacterium]